MELRSCVQIEGIPITWETNLSDSDLRDLYRALCRADSLKELKINVFGACILGIKYVAELVPFRDGFCHCCGVGDKISVVYRTTAEWAVVKARQQELNELKQEQEQEAQLEAFLFITTDRDMEQRAKDAIRDKRFGDVVACLKVRADLRVQNEQYRTRVPWMWHHQLDFTNLLASLPTSELGITFLKDCDACWHWYTGFAHAWMFWRSRYHSADYSDDIMLKARFVPEAMPIAQCLSEVRKIAEAGMALLPDDWMLHKDFCLLFDRYNDTEGALWVCRHAVEKGLRDDTKTGFIGRLKRLEGKAKRQAHSVPAFRGNTLQK